MALTVSNNSAVATASYYLGKNQSALQSSIKKLASGKKLIDASADPGTLSVAMKVRASINRLSGAQNNIQNGIGFLEVQDGLLDTVGKIVMRMSELKGFASQDPMKGEQDIASYNSEFQDLQVQLYQISQMGFNGMSLFANNVTGTVSGEATHGDEALFTGYLNGKEGHLRAGDTTGNEINMIHQSNYDNTLSIFTSSEGSNGPAVSIHKSLLLSALTLHQLGRNAAEGKADASGYWSKADNSVQSATYGRNATTLAVEYNGSAVASATNQTKYLTLASEKIGDTLTLDQVSAGVFGWAIENVTFLRAQTGGGLSRLNFAAESIATQETNMRSALGRIEDVDMAEEASNLAKYSILMQASAAMVAQANSTSQVALMLLQV
jgi:flagellin